MRAVRVAVVTAAVLLSLLAPNSAFSQSSARHCISGNSFNVHAIGWVDVGSPYTITFESDVALASAVVRLDLDGKQASVGYGDPDLRFTASGNGTLALYVSGRGQPGCYRYRVDVEPPSALVQRSAPPITTKAAKDVSRTRAIWDTASSAKYCVAGHYVAAVHPIGRVEQGAGVRVTFESDFDPIAGLTNVNPDTRTGTHVIDDDSGGDLDPQLNVTVSEAGTLALFVTGVKGGAGCYSYKVEVTPRGGAVWSRSGEGTATFERPLNVARVRVTARYVGAAENFSVFCGNTVNSGIVDQVLGTTRPSTTYEGVHNVPAGCTQYRIILGAGVSWTFTEVR